jgi:hypothetical protein
MLIFLALISSILLAQTITENDWHTAFNEKVTHGVIESVTPLGRVDILTDNYAIEVDYVRNYRDGIRQALQYAGETNKKPGIALIIDGAGDSFYSLVQAKILCNKEHLKLWLVNEYVTVEDLLSRKNVLIKTSVPATQGIYENLFPEETGINNNKSPTISPKRQNVIKHEQTTEYWLNTKTGVRHNKSCRWYNNTKNGRPCGPEEGRPCGQCGG